jgi:hypothetical protein
VTGRCRLHLGRYAHGNGETLQDAGDDLVARLLSLALCFRSGFTTSTELPPDLRWLNFVYEVGDIAARGGDVRERIFGSRGTPRERVCPAPLRGRRRPVRPARREPGSIRPL